MGEYWIVWAVLDVKRGVRFEFIWQDREYRDCYQGLGLGGLAIFRYGSVRSCHSRQALDKVVGLTIFHRYGGGDSWICQP